MQTETTVAPVVAVAPVIADKAPAKKAKAPKAKVAAMLQLSEEIFAIPVGDIDDSPENNTTRQDVGIDPKYVTEDLMPSIAKLGQQTPIVVQKVPTNGKPYRMVSGYCRLSALKQLGHPTVQARVEVTGTDEARVLGNVVENLGARKEVTALGAAKGVEALLAEGRTVAEVAEFMGKAEDYVRDLGRIAKGAPEVREALQLGDDHENGVTWAVARLVLRFPRGEQARLLKKVQKLSVSKAREVLAEERGGKKAPATVEADAGEGEETESESRDSTSSKHDVVIPEGKVVKATVPFVGTLGTGIAALREALANGNIGDAEKAANVMAKALIRQETMLRELLGNKVYEAAEKRIADAAKAK